MMSHRPSRSVRDTDLLSVPRAQQRAPETSSLTIPWAAGLVAVTIAAFTVILSVGPSPAPEAVTAVDDLLAIGALLTLGGAVGAGLSRSGMTPWLTMGFGGFLALGQVSCLVIHGAPATAGWFWIQNLAIAALFVAGGLALGRR